MKRFICLCLAGVVMAAGCNHDTSTPDPIDVATADLSKYEDLAVALSDGYLSTYDFVDVPGVGGMGIHFFNPTITGSDPTQPAVLMYTLSYDGQYELVAAEWFVLEADVTAAPVLFDQTFAGPMPDHQTGNPPNHYDLHAWFFRDNPAGMFADFNPNLAPPVFMEDLDDARAAILGAGYDVSTVAVAAGYDPGPTICVPNMGVHFDKAGIDITDASPADVTLPNVLLYEPDGTGGYTLVAAEWYALDTDVSAAPVLFDQTFEGPTTIPGLGDIYSLHVWLFKPNPDGMFTDMNPTVACP